MEKRHDELLTTLLETVLNAGVAHVLWAELYRWYGTQKIAARTRRDLAQRWSEISEDKYGELQQVVGRDGIFLMPAEWVQPVYEPKSGDDE
jgi:hypothetical protein